MDPVAARMVSRVKPVGEVVRTPTAKLETSTLLPKSCVWAVIVSLELFIVKTRTVPVERVMLPVPPARIVAEPLAARVLPSLLTTEPLMAPLPLMETVARKRSAANVQVPTRSAGE